MININIQKPYVKILDFVFLMAFLQIFLQYGKFNQILIVVELITIWFGIFSLLLYINNFKNIITNKSNILIIIYVAYSCILTLFTFNYSASLTKDHSLLLNFYNIGLWPMIFLGLNVSKEVINIDDIKKRLIFWSITMLIPFGYLVINSKQKWVGSIYLVYFSIFLIPLFILLFNNKQKIIFMSLYILGLLYVGKRGGILAISLGFCCYMICEYYISSNKKKLIMKLSIVIISLALLIIIMAHLVNLHSIKFINRFSRVAEDGGSGRIELWKQCLLIIQSMSTKNLIFGNGFYGTYKLLNYQIIGAHNDIFEIIIDYGLIGFIFYLLINLRWIYYGIKLVLNKSTYGSIMIFEIIMYAILGQISFMFWISEIMIVYILAIELLIKLSKIEQKTQLENNK